MASEIRVNTINSSAGLGTITVSQTGQDLAGITTVSELSSSGKICIGHGTNINSSFLQVMSSSASGNISVGRWSNDANGSYIDFYKSRNASVGSNTIVQDDDTLGNLSFYGDDASGSRSLGAEITAYVDGSPGTNDMPTRLVFKTSADGSDTPTERMRIDALGNIVIGATANSNTSLDRAICIGSVSYTRPGLVLRGSTTNKGDISFCDNSGSESGDGVSEGLLRYDHNGDYMCIHTADTERIRIKSDGKVGIGTSVPTSIVHADAGSGDTYIQITNSTSGPATGDGVKIGLAASDVGLRILQQEASYIRFDTSGTERLRIDQHGKFYHQPSGNGSFEVKWTDIDSNGPYAKFWNSDAVYGGGVSIKNNNALGGVEFLNTSGNLSAAFYNSTGGWHWGGNLILDSGGIGFNDNAVANHLDDYEEGDFTPLMGGTNYGTYNVTGTGKYTKIGRAIFCEWKFSNKDLDNSASGAMRIRGWPFAFDADSNSDRPISSNFMMHNVELPTSGDNNTYCLYGDSNGIAMNGMRNNDGSSWTSWDISNFQSSQMYFEGSCFMMAS